MTQRFDWFHFFHSCHDIRVNLKRISTSLVTRLMALGLLVLILGTTLTYWQLTRFLREDLTQTVSAQQLALASYVARDIDRNLADRLQFLERLAAALPEPLLGQPERLHMWLREQHDLNPLFARGLMVVDASGRVIADHRQRRGPGDLPTEDTPDLRTALAGRSEIGRPRGGSISAVPAQPILPFRAPVKGGSGQVLAVLVGTAELSAPGFLDGVMQGRIGQSGGILLISPSDKVFVASSIPAMVFTPTPPPGINALHDRAMAGFRGTGITINANGIEELSAIAPVPSTGWFVVARIPAAEALATVGRAQSFILRHRAPGALAVLLVIGFFALRALRPLFRAADLADKMSRGDIPLAPLPVVRADEIGALTAAFNRLLIKLREHQAELALLAHHDDLTGLPNRKLLADRLQQALARAQRNNTQVAVLFLDLDGFKRVNDSLGHEAGDEALKEVAGRLSGVVRQTDTVARLGGDEFVVLAADFDAREADSVGQLAQKCITAISQPMRIRGTVQTLGASIGIALSGGGRSADELLAAADRAMYAVKHGGRGGHAVAPAAD